MSHFTVVVVGEDPEAQLEPFSEHIEVEEYPEPLDLIAKEVNNTDLIFYKDGLTVPLGMTHALCKYLGNKWDVEYNIAQDKIKDDLEGALRDLPFDPYNITEEDHQAVVDMYNAADHEFETYVLDPELGPSRLTTYNPDSKWDWYVIGGRWHGFFKVREDIPEQTALGQPGVGNNDPMGEGKRADQLMIGSVDFDGMRDEVLVEAEENFNMWLDAIEGCTGQDLADAKGWSWYRDKAKENADYDIDEARSDYKSQAVIKACKEYERENGILLSGIGCPIDKFGLDKDAYLVEAVKGVGVPFAVLKDGEWHEKGRMGWFGTSEDKMTKEQWNEQVEEMYKDLNPTTLLTLVDCHI